MISVKGIGEKPLLVLFIIILVIISQLALTIYLPSMPRMVHDFKTDTTFIQTSITVYLVGYGISQFIYGPVSDIYGRRNIILFGVSFFTLASLICLFANSIYIFLLGRFLQGLGIGCGDTMGRVILCDRFQDSSFVKAACHIGMAATVTQMAAPIIGSYVAFYSSWEMGFFIIFIFSLLSVILFYFFLLETKPTDQPCAHSISSVVTSYTVIMKNKTFIRFFLPGAVCFLGEMAYNLMSSFLLQNQLGWMAVGFGWLNMITIVGLLFGTLLANRLASRIHYSKMVLFGMRLLSLSALMMLIPAIFHVCNSGVIIMPMLFFMIGVGIIYPNTNAGALMPFSGKMAGTAGALQGGMQMVLGGVLGLILSRVIFVTQLPLAITLSILTLASYGGFVLLSPSYNN